MQPFDGAAEDCFVVMSADDVDRDGNVSTDNDPRYRYTGQELKTVRNAGATFEIEADGLTYKGRAVLTEDGRIVMISESGQIGVVPMTEDGATRSISPTSG